MSKKVRAFSGFATTQEQQDTSLGCGTPSPFHPGKSHHVDLPPSTLLAGLQGHLRVCLGEGLCPYLIQVPLLTSERGNGGSGRNGNGCGVKSCHWSSGWALCCVAAHCLGMKCDGSVLLQSRPGPQGNVAVNKVEIYSTHRVFLQEVNSQGARQSQGHIVRGTLQDWTVCGGDGG